MSRQRTAARRAPDRRWIAALGLVAILSPSCGAGPGESEGPLVALIALTPVDSSLWVGQRLQLHASVRDTRGQTPARVDLQWAASNAAVAQVTDSGVVTGMTAGPVTITARSGSTVGTATLLVRDRPAVTAVRLELGKTTFEVAETTNVTATPIDATGQVATDRAVTWTSSDPDVASVLGDGFFTAITPGTAIITASVEGVTAQSTVTIVAPSAQSAPWPHEPPGMMAIDERDFSTIQKAGWITQAGAGLYLEADSTAPKSPPMVAVQRYPAGFEGGSSPAVAERNIDGVYTTLYVSYWVKFSANWVGHASSVNKVMHIWIAGGNHVYTLNRGSGAEPLSAEIALQGVVSGGQYDNGQNGNFAPNLVTQMHVPRGQWQRWEIVLKANTTGTADGSVEWWINGVKVGSYSRIQFTPTASKWDGMQWSPTWGGVAHAVPADQFMSLDHVYLSGR